MKEVAARSPGDGRDGRILFLFGMHHGGLWPSRGAEGLTRSGVSSGALR